MATRSPHRPAPTTVQVIDPRWLLKAGGLAFLAALLCAYIALCILFWQGQWQLVLAPSPTVATTPNSLQLSFTPVTFGPGLTGWWVPSDSSADPTALLLHTGSGNMADALPSAQALHAARLNVLVFDYRGFGQSSGPHPSQARMQQDAASALDYLLHTRAIAPSSIVLYGEGVGASLAASLASRHPEIPALMLIYPAGDLAASIRHDPRARLAPVSLLFHERFPLAAPLQTLATPKLIVSTEDTKYPLDLHTIADPKLTVELQSQTSNPGEPLHSISRFLDTYITRAPAQLHPN